MSLASGSIDALSATHAGDIGGVNPRLLSLGALVATLAPESRGAAPATHEAMPLARRTR